MCVARFHIGRLNQVTHIKIGRKQEIGIVKACFNECVEVRNQASRFQNLVDRAILRKLIVHDGFVCGRLMGCLSAAIQ